MDYTMLDKIVESHKDDLIAIIRRWISVNSVKGEAAPNAPFGPGPRKALDLALEDAKRLGFETEDVDGYAGSVRFGGAKAEMGILAHLDIVPAGDGWTKDPFGGEIENNRLNGRGTTDDKGPAAAALIAMLSVKEAGIPLTDGVRLILGCDEETGMSDMKYYAEHRKTPDYGFSPDADYPLINIEKGGLSLELSGRYDAVSGAELPIFSMTAGERINVVPGQAEAVIGCADEDAFKAALDGLCAELGFTVKAEPAGDGKLRLIAIGQSAHASTPHLGKNAAGMLLILLDRLNAGGKAHDDIRFLAEKLGLDGTGKGLDLAQSDEKSGALTCNLGILRFEDGALSVKLDCRYPLCADKDRMIAAASDAVRGTSLTVGLISHHAPHYVSEDHKVVKKLLKAYGDVTGLPAYAFAIGGGTYSRCMPNTVAFGINFPGTVDMCHMPDEAVDIDRLMLSVRIMAHAIAELAGEQNAE